MKVNVKLLRQIESDLGFDRPFVKGQDISIKNCWHFSTDGNAVDSMFYEEEDFVAGMNRVFIVSLKYNIVILAFCLMDTHVHFVLWGLWEDCNRFLHDYVRDTSRYISFKHGERNKLDRVPINHQAVDTDSYLKTVICYVIKNAPVGGIPFNAWDYPWSSGPLYFRHQGWWSSPAWLSEGSLREEEGVRMKRELLKSKRGADTYLLMIGKLVFPGEYVAYELVERLFKTCKGFNYFICVSKEKDVESRGGAISRLSIPMQEMRQHKNELCKEMFGTNSIKGLDTKQRIRLAATLKFKYDSSVKQIARLTGLVYEEIKDMI